MVGRALGRAPGAGLPFETLNIPTMPLGIPCHFRPGNANVSACGIECPDISAYDGRDVNCVRCRRTRVWRVYMGRPEKSSPAPPGLHARHKGMATTAEEGMARKPVHATAANHRQ
jgi:hypothetical protein